MNSSAEGQSSSVVSPTCTAWTQQHTATFQNTFSRKYNCYPKVCGQKVPKYDYTGFLPALFFVSCKKPFDIPTRLIVN